MKRLLLIITSLLYISGIGAQEDVQKLRNVSKDDGIIEGQAIIYGVFIQRLEKKSAGYPQYITLENTETHDMYMFQVKPTMKNTPENIFCYHIAPGTYRIVSYYWVISNWYGGTAHTEPVYKGIKADKDFNRRFESGEIKEEELKSYTITVRPNTASYLGIWNFKTEPATFGNDKEALDKKLAEEYPLIDFSSARVVLPQ